MTTLMGLSKVTRNFRITLNKDILKLLKLKAGDRVAFLKEGKKIYLKPTKIAIKVVYADGQEVTHYARLTRIAKNKFVYLD